MITIDAFKAYGTRTGSPTQIPLDEITLLASPATLKALGDFLVHAAQCMEEDGMEHLHLQDAWADFDPRLHVDLVLVNSEQASEHAPQTTTGDSAGTPHGCHR
ncbi:MULTISPECIES: hypothetical protein [unclassified Pseudomonas]|uniref:Imm32 family immunity protein n=1 Tax=unclassified Pseudomonas TaxID=196821 RepID=UPI000838052E|nr:MULTISPECIES: hypothetical protein [unclassified Pseudomonas]QIH07182.1 hypothetical protein ATY02_10835 [Pseudomonas sp. BIOMIG1BAC]